MAKIIIFISKLKFFKIDIIINRYINNLKG